MDVFTGTNSVLEQYFEDKFSECLSVAALSLMGGMTLRIPLDFCSLSCAANLTKIQKQIRM